MVQCLPPGLAAVLGEVSRVLSGMGVRWVLVGSVASCLNDVGVEPRDIDIIVEADKIYEIGSVFASRFRVLRSVEYGSSGVFSSHYGVFDAGGIRVELMADLKICGEHGCLEVGFEELYRYSRSFRWGGVSLRVAPLEWQLVASLLIPGKEERVGKILEVLRARGVDTEVLDSVLSRAPPSLGRRVSELLDTHL